MAHLSTRTRKTIFFLCVLLLCTVAGIWALIYAWSQKTTNTSEVELYIPHGSTFNSVVDSLNAHNCIGNQRIFTLMAKIRQYKDAVKPGHYSLNANSAYWNTLTKLYYGNQDPVHITINKHRTAKSLCTYLGRKLEIDAEDLLSEISDSCKCSQRGFSTENIMCMFVQNTYDVYWTVSAEKFLDRMEKEYNNFWNEKRRQKCHDLGMTPTDVTILASIVEEETNANDEKADIASVYLNRLHKGMLLQADPTVKYAVGDFTLKRILNKHTQIDNPYNTYVYKGLPPGPICIPGSASIDSVLANKQTDYLYFCAKSDFSGRHAFASTLSQHTANANAFHLELNRRKIYR